MNKQEELQLILAAHRRWLETDKEQGKRAELSGAMLDGVDLSGALLKSTVPATIGRSKILTPLTVPTLMNKK